MRKYSLVFIMITSFIMFVGCQKKDAPTPPPADTKLDFYYKNPKGETINNPIINIPGSSVFNTSIFESKYGGSSPLFFKWKVIDSITNKLLIQNTTATFEYLPLEGYSNGTQALKLYAYKSEADNNANKAPIDSVTKVLHISNRKNLKSIVVDSLSVSRLFVPDTAKTEVFLRIYQRNKDGKRKDVPYYETPHLQNIRNLSTNINLSVDTTKIIPSAPELSSDGYTFVLYALYKGRTFEALSNDIGPVVNNISLSQSSDKSQLLETRRYWEINQQSMMTIRTSYTYMKGK